jgi:hypothetical protein
MTTISTIRPGLLVSLKTSLKGNVHYDRYDLERDTITAEGESKARWETLRTIADPAEYEAMTKVRNKGAGMIRGACTKSAFGLLCPEANIDNLNRAIADANRLVDESNRKAKLTRVDVYTIVGRIEPNDVEAVRAIKGEISDLISTISDGVKNLDVKAIRAAAAKARSVAQMLPDDAKERVKEAIATGRKVATAIKKAGEDAAVEIDKEALRTLASARTAFLDFDDEDEVVEARPTKVGGGVPRMLDL